ncbi:Nitrous oxide reductase maturation protein NosD [hydrothermal vent metagenome]|uniref:Nitrous oxide reductase maturation protein NosD n=1 Tax=hydrothermal vent metagenome TaxID=652676 RepID=A0A3B1C8N4_9ZZZZ
MIQYKIFLILILSISYYTPILSQIYVEESGSIQKAINSANPGDTIFVKKGIYYESDIVVNKAVVIIGDDYPIVDAQEKGVIFEITSDSVTISGLKIINVGKSYTKDFSAIHAYKIKHFAIINNIFENPFFAIHIEKSKWGVIANNTIIGNAVEEANSGNGIHMWHTSRIEVNDNRIEHMRDGIYFEFVKHSSVKRNKSRYNIRYGLHFMFSNDDVYEENLFENNGAGVAVMFSKKIIMRKNIFKLNWGTASYGLLLKEIYDADIIENIFEQNTIGVNAEGSNRIMYERNNFNNNGWAIKFLGGCYGNKLHQNNFMNNAFDISYNGRINGNVFDKNYWSEYAGYDLDRDGVGDVPYRPVKLFSYVVNRTPETIVLLRSLFVDIINYSEKVSPIFTPDNLKDFHPLMKPVK